MASTRTYSRSFAGGEISPEMFGRIDDAKYQSGAATLRNFMVAPTGPAENRPGLAFVKATKNNGVARLIPFTYSLGQTMVIELGEGYARFHTDGATLEYAGGQPAFKASSAVTYTVANPTVIGWVAHGLSNGTAVVLAMRGPVAPGLHLKYPAGIAYGPYSVAVIDADSFHLFDSLGNPLQVTALGVGNLVVQPNYAAGSLVSFVGSTYYRPLPPPSELAGIPGDIDTNPATDGYWHLLPADSTYEIQTPYMAADLFDIHFAQSADVMTLVHPNYRPYELRRLSSSTWTFVPISFGPPLDTPQGVTATASPGYEAKISSISTAAPALITTVASHTLALGDGIYLANLTAVIAGNDVDLEGFYMVSKVPVDISGNLIPNELYLMDYSGNDFDSTSWSSHHATDGTKPITIQFGTKIFNITNQYAVQAIAADGVSSSALSDPVSILDNLDVPGSYNTIEWNAVEGAHSYNVYKQYNGLWGFIGNAKSLSFVDNNIAPDFSIVPGTPDQVFGIAGDYPGAVCYFQQRRCFAGTNNGPQNVWMSNSGTESMFSFSLPSLATDRIAIRMAALKADVIRHLVPMTQLIALTSETEFAEQSGVNGNALTPSTVGFKPQSYIGASGVQPSVINTSMVYAAARGGHVRELGYAWTVNGFQTGDLSLRAAHLFDNLTIVDQAYAKSPKPIIWFVSSNGKLLGLTYIPEEQLGAWHQHDTQGSFESICAVAEGSEDFLYAVVKRQVNGSEVRYVERMASRIIDKDDSTTWFFVDAGATWDGSLPSPINVQINLAFPSGYGLTAATPLFDFPGGADVGSVLVLVDDDGKEFKLQILTVTSATQAIAKSLSGEIDVPGFPHPPPTMDAIAWGRNTVSGLTWLEGETVAVLADGAVQSNKVVTAGKITLDHAAAFVAVGLAYTSDLLTLPAVLQIDGFGQGRTKNISRAWLKVYQSSGIFVGPDEDHLTEVPQRTTEPFGSPPSLQTGEVQVLTTPDWQTLGQALLRQEKPLPLSVVGLTLEVAIGG